MRRLSSRPHCHRSCHPSRLACGRTPERPAVVSFFPCLNLTPGLRKKQRFSRDLTGGVRYSRDMKAIGYVRVSTEKQADCGVSLEAQSEKVRAMAVVQGAELAEVIIDAGESAKSLNRPGMARLLSLVDAGAVDTVIIAKLDRLTRSVADLAELLKRFERRGVSLVSVADSLDTRSAAGRLVL